MLNKFTRTAIYLTLVLTLLGCDSVKKRENNYQWPIIAGFPKPQVPENNPMSADKVALGKFII